MSSEVVAALPPFAKLDQQDLDILGELIVERTFAPGEIIFVEGERSEGLWFIQSGRVRIFKSSPDGRELTLCLARSTNQFCMGTCPLFDEELNPGTAQAVDSVTLYFIHRQNALARAAESPEVGRALGLVLANRYRHFSRLASNLALRCSQSRIAHLLLDHLDGSEAKADASIELDMELSQAMIASIVGVERTMVARTMALFERRGILTVRGRRILVTDRKKLEQAT